MVPGPRRASGLAELAEHGIELSNALERAWSKALDEVVADETHTDFVAEWRAFFTELFEQTQTSEVGLERAGIDPRLYPPLLAQETVDALAQPADRETGWRRLLLARVLSVEPLAKAVGAVTEPSSNELSVSSGERRQWWESGAFALVRARARLLVRLDRLTATAERALLDAEQGSAAFDPGIDAYERVLLAGQARSLGDPEAALLHIRHALLGVLRTHERDASGDRVGGRLAELPSLTEYGTPLKLLDDVVDPRASHYGDLALNTILVEVLLPLARELVRHPPAEFGGREETT